MRRKERKEIRKVEQVNDQWEMSKMRLTIVCEARYCRRGRNESTTAQRVKRNVHGERARRKWTI